MKLAAKLIAVLVLGLFIVATAFEWVRVRREVSLFDSDIRRDHTVLGGTLGGSVANVFRYDGRQRALDLVTEADRLKNHLRLRWVWPDAGAGEPGPVLADSRLGAMTPGSIIHLDATAVVRDNVLVTDADGGDWLITYAAVPTPPGRVGAIEIAESLAPKRAYIRATVLNAVASTGVMLVTCALIVLGLSLWLVGRPLAKLVDKARRVGAGDLSGPLGLAQRDEVGELAREMNAMCDRLGSTNERLRGEVEARIAALEQLRHADRLMTVGRLAVGIAHELGTPLNVVTGRAQLIARGKVSEQDARNYARIVVEQCERIAGIIRQLLDYARIREPKRTRQDVRALAAQTLNLLRPLAEKRALHLELAAGDPVPANVDALRIQQAITNLLVNAMHASTPGQTIRVLLGQTRQRAPLEQGGLEQEAVLLAVSDEGAGISDEDLARIFDPFFTTKPVGEGSGLGLSVTQGIVREHHGWITVDTAVGRGTTFGIHLPCTA